MVKLKTLIFITLLLVPALSFAKKKRVYDKVYIICPGPGLEDIYMNSLGLVHIGIKYYENCEDVYLQLKEKLNYAETPTYDLETIIPNIAQFQNYDDTSAIVSVASRSSDTKLAVIKALGQLGSEDGIEFLSQQYLVKYDSERQKYKYLNQVEFSLLLIDKPKITKKHLLKIPDQFDSILKKQNSFLYNRILQKVSN